MRLSIYRTSISYKRHVYVRDCINLLIVFSTGHHDPRGPGMGSGPGGPAPRGSGGPIGGPMGGPGQMASRGPRGGLLGDRPTGPMDNMGGPSGPGGYIDRGRTLYYSLECSWYKNMF